MSAIGSSVLFFLCVFFFLVVVDGPILFQFPVLPLFFPALSEAKNGGGDDFFIRAALGTAKNAGGGTLLVDDRRGAFLLLRLLVSSRPALKTA